ncbi:beta-1,3-glucan-binding protein-like [Haliotis rufescens]|uniref:beta-1,3-glucan-binding protein-like n=1 Tax=Haliotis rufescens TaxID=6454 RepID=UPI00201EE95B|nr:beta-1,3-glucan-binding protein-like [Haliotis rufescens]
MAISVFFTTLLAGLCYASLQPAIKQDAEKNEVILSFPSVPGVDTIELSYALHLLKQQAQLPHLTNTIRVHKQADGYFTYRVQSKNAFTDKYVLEYSVKYLSATGDVLHHLNNVYIIPPASSLSPRLYRRGTTVLSDFFHTNHLDSNTWTHEITCWGGGGGEFQMYTPEAANTYIRNGILYLRPTYTVDKFGENFLHNGDLDVAKQWGTCTYYSDNGCHRQGSKIPPIMSSKLYSKASITYGKIEVVAQLPKGDWLWPAIWMLPPSRPWKYGGWPASGEIDIMEARGNLNLKDSNGNDHGAQNIRSTLHWGVSNQHRSKGYGRASAPGTVWADNFHTYSIDWTSEHIRLSVDDHPVLAWSTPSQGYWSYSHLTGHNIWASGGKDAPFDGKMGLILNVAVGDNSVYFSDSWHNPNGKPWKNGSPTAMADFWKNKHQWQPTWHGEDAAMKIKSVKMIQYQIVGGIKCFYFGLNSSNCQMLIHRS